MTAFFMFSLQDMRHRNNIFGEYIYISRKHMDIIREVFVKKRMHLKPASTLCSSCHLQKKKHTSLLWS